MAFYRYIGPEEIRQRAEGAPAGAEIKGPADLAAWLAEHREARSEGATFVVTVGGVLRLAPRRSEHVACAEGEPVRAAGEVQFQRDQRGNWAISEATNQSTGYGPEPESFVDFAASLARAGLRAPAGWSHAFLFRRCPGCGLLNLVKEGDFTCAACDRELPRDRNF